MFSKRKVKWFGSSFRAILISAVFYFIAKMFLRGAEKQAGAEIRRSGKKKSK